MNDQKFSPALRHLRLRSGSGACISAVALLAIALLTGCGGFLRTTSGKRAIDVPPGVSPAVAARADSLTLGLFVPLESERKAQQLSNQAGAHWSASDSLWAILDSAKVGRKTVTKEDSVQAEQHTKSGDAEVKHAAKLVQEFDKTQERQLIIQASFHLDQARKALEKSVQLDPFNKSTQNLLALVYRTIATRFPHEMNYDKALHIWGTLIRLEPGEYKYHYKLAETYFLKQQWSEALDNFQKTEDNLLATAEVSPLRVNDPSKPVNAVIDSTTLFYSVWYQGQCASRLLNAEQALHHLKRAWNLTPAKANRSAIESTIAWINWDDGNIRASVMLDTATALVNRADRLAEQGSLTEAKKYYKRATEVQEDMLSIIKTTHARHETEWTLAYIEYTHLNRQAAAVNRLLSIVESMPKDSLGAPLDSTYRNYFDTYGTMCHNLGVDEQDTDRRLAYTYFLQATTIHWQGRAKSFLALADLSSSNPKQMVEYGERALALSAQLAADELLRLHKLLVDGYRRLREVNKARYYFDKLKILQQDTSNGPSDR
jgi:tetratricopeptide (TPR) repeat protein